MIMHKRTTRTTFTRHSVWMTWTLSMLITLLNPIFRLRLGEAQVKTLRLATETRNPMTQPRQAAGAQTTPRSPPRNPPCRLLFLSQSAERDRNKKRRKSHPSLNQTKIIITTTRRRLRQAPPIHLPPMLRRLRTRLLELPLPPTTLRKQCWPLPHRRLPNPQEPAWLLS